MSELALSALREIDLRINRTVRRIGLSRFLAGAAITASAAVFLWTIAATLEAAFWLPTGYRTSIFWALVAIVLLLLIALVVRPLLQLLGLLSPPKPDDVARAVGARFPEVSDKLINLLHLGNGRHSPADDSLVSAAVTSLAEQISPVPFERVEEFSRPRRLGKFVLVALGLLAVAISVAPSSFRGASSRLLSPGALFVRPASFSFGVQPGSVEILRGQPLSIRATTSGVETPSDASVAVRYDDEKRIEYTVLSKDSSGTFRHDVPTVRRSLSYRLESGAVASQWFTVKVLQRPIVAQLLVQLDFPRYARIPRQILGPNVGDVSALRGTIVSLDVATDGPDVASAYVLHDDDTRDSLEVSRGKANGTFRVRRTGTYRIILVSEEGIENDTPISYTVRVLDDSSPSVVIIAPQPVHEIEGDAQVMVVMRIADDFGFRSLDLHFRLARSRFGASDSLFTVVEIPLQDEVDLLRDVSFDWDLNRHLKNRVVPGNEIEYFARVRDNDAVSGFKPASSPVYKLVVPSLADKIERLDEMGDQAEQTIEKMKDESREMRDQFNELRQDLQNDQSSDWDDERQLNQLERQQERVEETAEQLVQQLEEMTQRMEEDQLLSPETREMFQELRRVAEEIESQELKDALEQLREAMKNLDAQQMQEALDNFEFNEKQYQERLKRTLDLLEKLQMQQELEEVAELAKELAERQEAMSEETQRLDEENSPSEQTEEQREAMAEQQKQSAEDMRAVEERLSELEQKMQDKKNGAAEQMEDLRDEVERQSLPERMEQNAEQLQQNKMSPAQQGQQQMSQDLQKMQMQMSQMQQGMQGSQMKVDMDGLRRSLNDVLQLSEQQESLKDQLDALEANTGSLREQARNQLRVQESLRAVRDSLVTLSSSIPQMTSQVQEESSNALREMTDATSAMSEGVPRRASGHQRSAMMHLNELALILSDLLSAMNNSSAQAGGGQSMEQMMQQLQQMAGDQQELNGQIQQLLNDMAGQRLTTDMEERMRQLAGQQESLRNQLHEMSRNPQLRGKALGDLKQIAEQMEETIRELESRRASRRTTERQQQILTRLLESTRSLQERDKDDKRESRSAEELMRQPPGDLPPTERLDRLRRELIRALDVGYSPDYEELIKRYFELLQERQN